MGQRLRQARIAAKHRSARSAASRFGWSPSTYAAHENGQNQFDAETAVVYAKAFGIDASYLLLGDGPDIGKKYVPIVAMVDKKGEMWGRTDFDNTSNSSMSVRVRSLEVDNARGLIVVPGALWPQYRDWDLLIGWNDGEKASDYEGEAVVRLEEGPPLLRYIRPGRDSGRFDLETHVASPIRDAYVKWFMPIRYVVRFHHWISDWENGDIAKRMELMEQRTRNVLT